MSDIYITLAVIAVALALVFIGYSVTVIDEKVTMLVTAFLPQPKDKP